MVNLPARLIVYLNFNFNKLNLKKGGEMNFDATKFQKVGIKAVRSSMAIIRPYFMGKAIGEAKVKSRDKTLLTKVDRQSEDAGFKVLRKSFPDAPIVREEGGLSDGSADWKIWYDPIDGTRAFIIGAPTSTVICAAYQPGIGLLAVICN